MALTKTKKTAAKNDNFEQADAFMNLELVDKHNKRHSISKGLPLHIKNWLMAQMITAAGEDPDLEFNLVGKITIVVPDAEREQIAFT